MSDSLLAPVRPAEGWHVVHAYYRFDHASWNKLGAQQGWHRDEFMQAVEEIRAAPDTQLLLFSVLTPKADLGFMLLTPDLQDADRFTKRLGRALGPGVLVPTAHFLSLTEGSEYMLGEGEYIAETLKGEKKLTEGTPEFDAALAEYRDHMAKYRRRRVYPELPPWPVVCFYPMAKRRGAPGQNWYALPFEERKRLMSGHARVGRRWTGKILQLITGSTGLDEWEWGVTLLAKDPADVKGIVYEMRFDEVSAQYAEFGDFLIGLQLPPAEILARVGA